MGSHGFVPFRREFMPVEVRFQKHHINFERWRCVSASIDVFLEQCRGKKIVGIEALPGVEEGGNHTRRLYCLPPGIATCYPRSVNRNIFYIIGVIVVIVIVLKVLHVF
jgi:hypothetical protein